MPSETIATRLATSRFHASAQRLGEMTCCGLSKGIVASYLSCTRGSTALYIRSASSVNTMVATAT